MIFVSWNEAIKFCQKLNEILGLTDQYGYRLPTEAEWEYAARAGTNTRFSFGDEESELDKYAWFAGNSKGHPEVVGQKQPNPFGLFDMHGNVWEWCEDQYRNSYNGAPTDGSAWTGLDMAAGRVIRGGGWISYAVYCRSAGRGAGTPGLRGDSLGFRLSRTLP